MSCSLTSKSSILFKIGFQLRDHGTVTDGSTVSLGLGVLYPGQAEQTDCLGHLSRFCDPDEPDVVPVARVAFGEVTVRNGRTDANGLNAKRKIYVEVGVAQDDLVFDGQGVKYSAVRDNTISHVFQWSFKINLTIVHYPSNNSGPNAIAFSFF